MKTLELEVQMHRINKNASKQSISQCIVVLKIKNLEYIQFDQRCHKPSLQWMQLLVEEDPMHIPRP